MRTFSRVACFVCFGFAAALGGPAFALDGTQTPATAKVPVELYKNPVQAMRQGFDTYKKGDVKSAVSALEYAAAGGESLAAWQLGRMYADGEGVQQDDQKAYDYFSQIVTGYNNSSDPDPRQTAFLASAFVAVGVYSLNGIPEGGLKPDPNRAFQLFQYAATNFHDANAQYDLARMYLDGDTVPKDPYHATIWLNYAAEKNQMEAQALLGHILFTGEDGIPRQRPRGLMYLTLARESALAADPKKGAWILDLYDKDMKAAADEDRQMALTYLHDYMHTSATSGTASASVAAAP